MNSKFFSVLTILNFILAASIAWWVHTKDDYKVASLENELEELSEKKPHFLVSLLNKSANVIAKNEEKSMTQQAFQKRTELLKAGFCIKDHAGADLVIFADMTDANSLSYLKNVRKVLDKLNCSVYLIPISMFGEKSGMQAQLVWAAALQNSQKAFQLALTYIPVEDIANNPIKEAAALGLDIKKLANDRDSNQVQKEISDKTKLAESLGVGVPAIFLFNEKEMHILPPAEAEDLPKLIENPALDLAE